MYFSLITKIISLFVFNLQYTIRLKLYRQCSKTQLGTRLQIKLFYICLWMLHVHVVTSVSALARVGERLVIRPK
jgi:hypothetical protein